MSGPHDRSAEWKAWAETSSTSTDRIALAPDGTQHRAKVLSSSALRGTIVESISSTALRVYDRWNAPADFVRGLPLTLLGVAGASATITAYDPDAQTITLAAPLSVTPRRRFRGPFPLRSPRPRRPDRHPNAAQSATAAACPARRHYARHQPPPHAP